MKKAVYRLILFAAITAFVLFLSPSVKAEPNDTQTKQTQCIASDTKTLYKADVQKPTPPKQPVSDKETHPQKLEDEKSEANVYKDDVDNLKWAIKVIAGLVTAFVGFAFASMGVILFKNKKDYEHALADAKEAARDAKDAAKNARDLEKEARGILADIGKQAKTTLKEIDIKAQEKLESIDKLVAGKLDEIEKTSRKQKEESSSEFERQRKISELFSKSFKAKEAKDYETAADYYRQIVEDMKEEKGPDVYNNWGVALAELAENKKGKEAEELFNQAIEKYKKAIDIKPDYYHANNNWGVALTKLAKSKKGKEAEKLLNQAIGIYQKVIRKNPDYFEAYNNWGNALSYLAESKEGPEAEELFNQALEKYKKTIEIKPDHYYAHTNLGNVFSKIAKSKDDPVAEKLFNQAVEKHQKAIDINPDNWLAYNNWGYALLEIAKRRKDKEQEEIFKQAEEKILKAESINTGKSAYNLACLCARRGNEDKCKEWLKVAEKEETLSTREHAMADDDLKSVRDKDWFKKLRWEGE